MKNGFSLIEVLISIAVAVVILPAVVVLLSFGTLTSQQGENYTKAYTLAQQEMEKIYNLKKNADWDISNLGYAPSGSTIEFPINVAISGVDRCGNFICPAGSPGINDKYTRRVIVTVSWKERGADQEIKLTSYVTKQ